MCSILRSIAPAVVSCALLSLLACGDKGQPVTSVAAPSPVPTNPAPGPGPVPDALPPRTIRGTVTTVDGSPLAGVRITSAFGAIVTSDAAGNFVFSYPSRTDPSPCWLKAELAGFDQRQIGWTLGGQDLDLQPFVLQRTLLLRHDAPAIAEALYPGDLTLPTAEAYESAYCSPCRSILLEAPVGRALQIDLEWTGDAPLELWAWLGKSANDVLTAKREDGSMSASLTVYPPNDQVVLHVGLPYGRTGPQSLAQAVQFKLTAIYR